MVETALFSIFHRAPPAATPVAEREPPPAAAPPARATPLAEPARPATHVRPEPKTPDPAYAAEPPAPHPSQAEPAPRLDSVLEALGVHPPEPEPAPSEPLAAEPAAPHGEPEPHAEASAEACQPQDVAWSDQTPPSEAPAAEHDELEPPHSETPVEAFPPEATTWSDWTPPSEPHAAESTAHHGEPEPPHAEAFADAHIPAWPDQTPPSEPPAAELTAHHSEPEPLHAEAIADTHIPAWPEQTLPQEASPTDALTWHGEDPAPLPQAETQAAETAAHYDPEPASWPHNDDPPEQPQTHPHTAESKSAHAPVQHQLLGLANPAVFTVRASLGDSDPVDLTTGRAGIYRPAGFRPAPWSGFAYDTTDDRRTGLAAGTRLLTARGEIPVEHLVPGDAALGLRGPTLLPILWIGRSSADEPPILIEAGALGPDRPRRALCVAADHPVFVDPIPAPARLLVNGVTIYSVDISPAELFHIDVGSAEVLFADGLPVASAQPGHANQPG